MTNSSLATKAFPWGKVPEGADEGRTNAFKGQKMQIQTVRLTLISQKSKIFASFPQGKPLWRNFERVAKLEFGTEKVLRISPQDFG